MNTEKWRAESYTSPLGETGDYMTAISLTNGKICLWSDGSLEEEEVQEIADLLNSALRQPEENKN